MIKKENEVLYERQVIAEKFNNFFLNIPHELSKPLRITVIKISKDESKGSPTPQR